MEYAFYGIIFAVLVAAIVVIGLVVSSLYKRAPKGKAFVRTGWGGQKVVSDGGALIIPVLHETIEVNLSTLKLEVHRNGPDALRTKDKMKVDVTAAFYTRVKPDATAIGIAAQTLGQRTMAPDALKILVEDKFVDALRSVAAVMNLSDLNEKRMEFSKAVQDAIEHDLVKNGLELENVSITRLEQTDIKYMNENDVFDAEGLANITKVTQTKSKERNDVTQATRIEIEKRNFEANQQSLAIKQSNEFATLDQEREVETRRAAQESELVKQRAERTREADVAKLEAERVTTIARTTAQQAQAEATIKTEQELAIARQLSQIAIAEKSEAQSQAQAKADEARALSVKAAQAVVTAEAVATAERAGQVAVIAAQKKAEETAAGITVRAKAEADAADLQAQARLKLADVTERENEVKASGERALAEAANSLNSDQINLRLRTAIITAMPEITKNLAAPMAAVKGARIVSINGMGSNGASVAGSTSGGSNMPGQLTDAMLDYRLRVPLVDQLAKEVGIDFSKGMNAIFDSVGAELPQTTENVEAVEVSPSVASTPETVEMARLKKIVEKGER